MVPIPSIDQCLDHSAAESPSPASVSARVACGLCHSDGDEPSSMVALQREHGDETVAQSAGHAQLPEALGVSKGRGNRCLSSKAISMRSIRPLYSLYWKCLPELVPMLA